MYTCKTKITHSMRDVGVICSELCGEPSVGVFRGMHRCYKHSGLGRYVIRIGEVGKILSRHDTEEQAKQAFEAMQETGIQLQRISASKRRTILGK